MTTRNKVLLGIALAFTASCGGGSNGPAMDYRMGLVYFAPEEGADLCM